MAENKQDGIAIFDTLFTNNHICMMKLLLPLLSPPLQKGIAIYIKFQELQYTLQYFAKHPSGLIGTNTGTAPADTNAVLDSILPFCAEKERQSLLQVKNMMQNLQNLKDMMEMLETMKELFPESFSGASENRDFSQMAEMFSAFGGGISPEMIAAFSGGISPEMMTSFSSGISPEMMTVFSGGGISPDIFETFNQGATSPEQQNETR